MQRRDRYGRFAEMGGGFSFNFKFSSGNSGPAAGRVVGQSGEDLIEVEMRGVKGVPDGVYSAPSGKGTAVKAVLNIEGTNVKTENLKQTITEEDAIDINSLKVAAQPSGWTPRETAPGEPNEWSSEDGLIVRQFADTYVAYDSDSAGNPVNEIARGESWADIQKATADYEKPGTPVAASEPASAPELSQKKLITEKIEKRNKEVLEGIKAAGGDIDNISQEYLDGIELPVTTDNVKMTKEQHTEFRRKRVFAVVTGLKEAALSRDSRVTEDEDTDLSRRKAAAGLGSKTTRGPSGAFTDLSSNPEERQFEIEQLAKLVHGSSLRRGVSPETLQYLRETSIEQIERDLEKAVLQFHQGIDPRPRVQMSDATIQKILNDPDLRYRTTHEVRSEHSDTSTRTPYEATIGFHPSTPAEFRPTSGYIIHKDWVKADEEARTYDKRPNFRAMAGDVEIYGQFAAVLKPEVAGRTRYGHDDTLNAQVDPVAMTGEPNIDELLNANLSSRGRYIHNMDAQAAPILGFLDGYVRGDFSSMRDEGSSTGSYKYSEALISGSFSLEDVESIDVSITSKTSVNVPERYFGKDKNVPGTYAKEVAIPRLMEFATKDAFIDEGLTPDEADVVIADIQRSISQIRDDQVFNPAADSFLLLGYGQADNALNEIRRFLRFEEIKEGLEKHGVQVNFYTENGTDMFDAKSYGSYGREGKDYRSALEALQADFLKKVAKVVVLRRAKDVDNSKEKESVV